jgi:copper chaperone CopZ
MRTIVIATAATLLCAAPAFGELLRVEFEIGRNDCETCARAVRVTMQKVDGVNSVAVGLEEGVTILELREGNTVTLAQLSTVIKNNGLVSKNANVVARGSLVGDLFEVRFSGERLHVKGQLAKLARDRWTLVVPAGK